MASHRASTAIAYSIVAIFFILATGIFMSFGFSGLVSFIIGMTLISLVGFFLFKSRHLKSALLVGGICIILMMIFGCWKENFDKKFDTKHYLNYNNILSQFYRHRIKTA